ncbi:HNH endonuclease signature motif containing protein [uncultured Sanguibacteroides sp.]|nr:HNH endonuclease signature motif containing protein [uncultured Sanguibacteroides sp.]
MEIGSGHGIYVVDHIDTNRQNNRIENLRWLTKLENVLLNPIS